MAKKAGREAEKFVLRLPGGMRDRIKVQAEQNGWSMNQLLLDILEEKFPSPPGDDDILDELRRLLLWDKELKSDSKRWQLWSQLHELAFQLEESHRDTPRTEPLVYINRLVLDQLEDVAKEMDLPRDFLAEELIRTGLVRQRKALEESPETLPTPPVPD
jgi:hypothetical protein